MEKHLSLKEISSYIDGESADPKSVDRHLQRCATCASLHLEFSKISTHIQALPEPSLSENFAQRVTQRIDELERARQPRWLQLGVPLAAAAALILVGLFFAQDVQVQHDPTIANSDLRLDADPGVLMAELEQRFIDAPASGLILEELIADDVDTAGVSEEEMMLALVSADWFESFDREWEEEDDFGDSYLEFDPSEAQIFLMVLGEYPEEG